MSERHQQTTIIGAGLGGLSLALALHRKSIPCDVYELRPADYTHGGAIMLSVNALRILDTLGVLDSVKTEGFPFETLAFVTDHTHEVTGRFSFGSEASYGYTGLRVYRNKLIQILSDAAKECGIPIHYERKFSHVVAEYQNSVDFAFADGEIKTTSRLIGTDGTHSKVREYLAPNVTPTFTGSLGINCAIPYSKLKIPHYTYPMPVSISSKHGAFVMAPQDPRGNELFVGRQLFVQDKDRKGWDDLVNDQPALVDMASAQKSEWSEVVQSAMNAFEPGKMGIWAFHVLPPLTTWISEKGRVLIMGDSAHTVPPTSGQGANQAFEDGTTLAWLLQKFESTGGPTQDALRTWFDYRQGRIAKILELNRLMMNMRLPLAEQEKIEDFDRSFGDLEKLRWLFEPDVEVEMERLF